MIVRSPSWGRQTLHLGVETLLRVHREDACRLGCTPLPPEGLLASLEEGRTFSLEGGGGSVTYRLEPLVE